jgi:kynurenine formamidase
MKEADANMSTPGENGASGTILDLSVALSNRGSPTPSGPPRIKYRDHRQSLLGMLWFFRGLRKRDLPNEEAWAYETVRLSTHAGTHLDAPYHYASTMDGGKRALTIDEIPLPWCFQPGVKLDFRQLPDGHVVSAREIEDELSRIGHTLAPFEIVLVNTAAGAAQGHKSYVDRGCGMGREATLFLLERGVRLTGTDGWSWDAPFSSTAKRYRTTRDPSIIWEGHKAGRDIGYCHLEQLTNLEALPPTGFKVACFPVKVESASAGWTRAVAILD